LFFSGVRPAINAGLSVSRVGGSAQIKAMKKVAGTLRLDLASFRELESFAQFGSDLDKATQAKLNRGQRTVEVLKQGLNKPLTVDKQVAILYALTRGFLDDIPVGDIQRFEEEYLTWLEKNKSDMMNAIRATGNLPEDEEFKGAIAEFKTKFVVSEE
jgi:F-type H+-transporting ATPase subunit alpha